MQGLAHIDVAQTGDDALIAERCLKARPLAGAGARQHGGIEFIAERFGTETAQQRLLIEFGAGRELHEAEAARIVEGDDGAVGHVKDDMIVGHMLDALVMVAAEFFAALAAEDVKRAGHPEMHDQHLAGGEIGEQKLAAAAEAGDGLALELLDEIDRQRPAQIAAARLDFAKALALHHRRQAAAHRLHFGQFGHRLSRSLCWLMQAGR
jgi:hypothetical protein